MAKPKKDRTTEIRTVFDNLKYCSVEDLKDVIRKAENLIQAKKNDAIRMKEEAIAELQKQIEELKNN